MNLPIPTRPAWVRGVTDKPALLEAEHTTVMEWRRRLSLIEETYEVMIRKAKVREGEFSVKESFDALDIKNRQAVTGFS